MFLSRIIFATVLGLPNLRYDQTSSQGIGHDFKDFPINIYPTSFDDNYFRWTKDPIMHKPNEDYLTHKIITFKILTLQIHLLDISILRPKSYIIIQYQS